MTRTLPWSMTPLFAVFLAASPLPSAAPPPIFPISASFSPTAIVAGQSATFRWAVDTTHPGSCMFSGLPGLTQGGLQGSVSITPTTTVSVHMECDIAVNDQGDVIEAADATLPVGPLQPPTVTLTLRPPSISPGQSSTVEWHSAYSSACHSDQVNIGTPGLDGATTITPVLSGVISIVCTGPGGSGHAEATLRVGTPQVVLVPGTGGVRLVEGPGSSNLPVWVNFPAATVLVPFNEYFRWKMPLAPAAGSVDPDERAPSGLHIPVGPTQDGIGGSGCLVNYISVGGGPPNICLQRYLLPMADALRNAGFEIQVANYDWRQAWSRHDGLMRQAVDAALSRSNGEKIYLVGHSQGTQLIRYFLATHPEYRSKIALIFNIGAPHLGVPKSVMTNTSFTGGYDFGLGIPPMMITNSTGLALGSTFPASYHMNPSARLQEIVRANTEHWMFESYTQRDDGLVRDFPIADDLSSELRYMRQLSNSPSLFDRGMQIQDLLAADQHGIPSYQIVNLDSHLTGGWFQLTDRSHCDAGVCPMSTSIGSFSIPGDETIPTASSLGRFAGGPNLGSLNVSGTEHQSLVGDDRTLAFLIAAIQRERGRIDPTFDQHFPLLTDDQVLEHIHWHLPAPKQSSPASPRIAQLPASPDAHLDIALGELDAELTVTVTRSATGQSTTYRAARNGLTLLEAPAAMDPTMDLTPSADTQPRLRATSSLLFADGLGDDANPTTVAGARTDLESLDLVLPLPGESMDIRIATDRPITAAARLRLPGIARRIPGIALQAGETLRYSLDAGDGTGGFLLRNEQILTWQDDTSR